MENLNTTIVKVKRCYKFTVLCHLLNLNTTIVKVKHLRRYKTELKEANLNTTIVKVKLKNALAKYSGLSLFKYNYC